MKTCSLDPDSQVLTHPAERFADTEDLLGSSVDGTRGDLVVLGNDQEVKMSERCVAGWWRCPRSEQSLLPLHPSGSLASVAYAADPTSVSSHNLRAF